MVTDRLYTTRKGWKCLPRMLELAEYGEELRGHLDRKERLHDLVSASARISGLSHTESFGKIGKSRVGIQCRAKPELGGNSRHRAE